MAGWAAAILDVVPELLEGFAVGVRAHQRDILSGPDFEAFLKSVRNIFGDQVRAGAVVGVIKPEPLESVVVEVLFGNGDIPPALFELVGDFSFGNCLNFLDGVVQLTFLFEVGVFERDFAEFAVLNL